MTELPTLSWRDHARDALRGAGYHRGGARDAVIDLLAGQSCALSAQEIDDRLRSERRAVGRASVYRALEQLAELRLVARVEVGDGIARYEPNHPGGEHHHHVVCERCGRIQAFEDPDLESAIHSLSRRLSFDVGEHDVVLRGECAECRS
jgi:Fur family transcriptional regulator, ferric uptake regulator